MIDPTNALGYLSGLYLIKPEMDPSVLLHTASLIHIVDAVLCRLLAAHSGRDKGLWTLLGLVLGIWALGLLFFIADKDRPPKGGE